MTPYEEKTLKDTLQEEKSKLKNMSLKEKTWYIWEYYKLPIIGVVIGMILLYAIGSTVYHNSKYENGLTCIILNSKPTGEEDHVDDYFDKGFRQYIGLEKNQVINVDTSLNLTFNESSVNDFSYAEMMKITALISSKELDVMIANPEIIDHYGSQEGYQDLKELLPADLYEKVKDNLYSVTVKETGKTIACGIRLDHTDFCEKTGLSLDDPVLAIMCNTTHTDRCVNLIRYVFGLPAENQVSQPALSKEDSSDQS